MFLKEILKRVKTYFQRLLDEGRVFWRDGRRYFHHPELEGLSLPAAAGIPFACLHPDIFRQLDDSHEREQAREFIDKVNECEKHNLRILRALNNIMRRLRGGELSASQQVREALQNSCLEVAALVRKAREALRSNCGGQPLRSYEEACRRFEGLPVSGFEYGVDELHKKEEETR